MRLIQIAFTILLSITIISCNNISNEKQRQKKNGGNLSDAEFVLGNWTNIQENGYISEKWIKLDDSTYYGETFFVNNSDTISYEEIYIAQRGTEMFYIPRVNNQNADNAIVFRRVESKPDRLLFENPDHDFPQKIMYVNVSKDTIIAEISGEMNGQKNFVNFPMVREKN